MVGNLNIESHYLSKQDDIINYFRNLELQKINETLKRKASTQDNKFTLFFSLPKVLKSNEHDIIVDQIYDILYYSDYDVKLNKLSFTNKFDDNFDCFNLSLRDFIYNNHSIDIDDKYFNKFMENYSYLNNKISLHTQRSNKFEREFYVIHFDIDSDFRHVHYLKNDETYYDEIIKKLNFIQRNYYKRYARQQFYSDDSPIKNILDSVVDFINLVNDYQLYDYILKIQLDDNKLKSYYDLVTCEINNIIENEQNIVMSVSTSEKMILIKLEDDNNEKKNNHN